MKKLKHIFSTLVFFGGLAAIGILTVPAAMLFGMIAFIRLTLGRFGKVKKVQSENVLNTEAF